MAINYDFQAIVIGSGFGGSINTCRLSKKWPGKVLLLERGKRYPKGSFPRSPHDFANKFFWNVNIGEGCSRPKKIADKSESRGLFDIRNFDHMDAVVCAGLGGGSLIYANVFLQPPDEVFDDNWPATCKKSVLQPYYAVAKSVLGARPIPPNKGGDDPRRIIRTERFQEFAKSENRDSQLVDINVFFGNDFDNPLEIGVQDKNKYGAIQTSCVYCGECDVGCNTHSKNTLDLNYLFVAENRYQATIKTEMLVEKIVPLDKDGNESTEAAGKHGYKVYWWDLNDNKKQCTAIAKRVVVSAGAIGSTELLMRCRDVYKTLPNINDNLGKHFSGNGDFLSFVIGGERPVNPNYGPVITQRTDFNLYKDFNRQHAFVLEDASYPNFGAWYFNALPGASHLEASFNAIKEWIAHVVSGARTGQIGYFFRSLLQGDPSFYSSVLLCMGLDNSNGVMQLNDKGFMNIKWPIDENMPLYNKILEIGQRFKAWNKGKAFIPLPNWLARKNITVHSLGGCRIADDPGKGVTSADLKTFGQVFGYEGLYVADGAILPTSVGANPIATISAMSERVAEGITGIAPDADL